jgi:hypothetical protein
MANASRKQMGAGAKGKGDGSGANAEARPEEIGDNEVLSNRDKESRGSERGQDGKWNQTEQLQEHAANREPDEGERQDNELPGIHDDETDDREDRFWKDAATRLPPD